MVAISGKWHMGGLCVSHVRDSRGKVRTIEEVKPCPHDWHLDFQNLGVCRLCDEVRQYFPSEQRFVIITPGIVRGQMADKTIEPETERLRKVSHLKLSKFTHAERRAIAEDAIKRGPSVVSKEKGIPYSTLMYWMKKRREETQGNGDLKATRAATPGPPPGSTAAGPTLLELSDALKLITIAILLDSLKTIDIPLSDLTEFVAKVSERIGKGIL